MVIYDAATRSCGFQHPADEGQAKCPIASKAWRIPNGHGSCRPVNASGGSPFDLFSLVWGEERTLNTVKKLMANRPIFQEGNARCQ